MRGRNLSKIALVVFISILGLGAGAGDALAEAAKSSPSLQGAGRMLQPHQGAASSRSLTLAANQAPGQLRRISASTALPKNPAPKVITPGGGRDLLAPRSLRSPLVRLPRSSGTPNKAVSAAAPPANGAGPNKGTDRIVSQARHYLGTPYRRGGDLEKGRATDCSGFVQHVYQKSNIDLPRSSSEQAQTGALVSRTLDFARLRPGDLLFFGSKGRQINHVGIYAGDGQMIHASSHSGRVVMSDLSQPHLEGSFVVAKRLPEVQSAK